MYAITYYVTKKSSEGEGTEDDDVLEEKRLVRSGQIDPKEYKVVLKDVTKHYGSFLAVNKLCLGIKAFECFGLLGVNGAGKTTTFKMMTGEVRLSRGSAWMAGVNLKGNMKKAHRFIGYCPQFNALLDDLTGKETLIIYCLIRGAPIKECSDIATELAKEFKFLKHLNKRINHLSGGNMRKISTAIALIGGSPVILLDEPSTGSQPRQSFFSF